MGVVYYGLNLRTITVGQTDVVFALRYDYFNKRLAKPLYRLSDFVVKLDGKEYDAFEFSIEFHATHADVFIKVKDVKQLNDKFNWVLSGEIISEYSGGKINSSLYFDYHGTYDKQWVQESV